MNMRSIPADDAGPAVPAHPVETLVGPDGTARIVLDGKVYTLRITRARKLILTK
jgi:hemin uptake protein HemP